MDRRRPPVPQLGRRAALVGAAQAVALLAAACSLPRAQSVPPAPSPAPPTSTTATTAAPAASAAPAARTAQVARCTGSLPAVTRPTPIPYPGYTAVEPSTGLHVTARPQIVELATYRLEVKGKVTHELSLTYDELRCLPKITADTIIDCPGYFVDQSKLAGASLASVLDLAGPSEAAGWLRLTGVDGRTSMVSLTDAQRAGCFLAYEWEGEPLPVSHGFPVRAALPARTGGEWVKWLMEIEVS